MSVPQEIMQDAILAIKRAGVVVFPTETAYGLASDATNGAAQERLMAIKGRDRAKTAPLIVSDLAMAQHYAIFTPKLLHLAEAYWPGPLTLVLQGKGDLAPVRRSDGTVAIRVSSDPIATMLVNALGRPITATSANQAGSEPCYTIDCVKKQLAQGDYQPDVYLDAGPLTHRAPSTIVTERDGELVVLREGSITFPSDYGIA